MRRRRSLGFKGTCDARRHKEVIIVNRFAPKLNIYRRVWPALFRGAFAARRLGRRPTAAAAPINFGFWGHYNFCADGASEPTSSSAPNVTSPFILFLAVVNLFYLFCSGSLESRGRLNCPKTLARRALSKCALFFFICRHRRFYICIALNSLKI